MSVLLRLAALALVLTGCAGNPAVPEPRRGEVLVTFALPGPAPEPAGGSRRAYHSGGDGWHVPLYTRQQVNRFARDHGLRQTDAWPIPVLDVYCVAFAIEAGAGHRSPEALLPHLDADPRSQLVQLNATFTGMSVSSGPVPDKPIYDDPLVDVQYGEFVHQLAALHAVTSGDAVRVGVIDTSVDLTHPDLSGQVTRQIEFVPAAEPAARLHGTAVTGVIAAAPGNGEGLVGMAPRANVHVYGACSDDAEGALCTSFSIAQALADAIDERMQVINMSFAGPDDPLIALLLDAALDAETVLVAAGSSDDAPDAGFPAGHPGVHAADGERHLWFASPERLSTRAGGSYQMFYGSSIASAGMSGLAALLRTHTSAEDTSALLDWLLEGNCNPATQPASLDPIRREQLCD